MNRSNPLPAFILLALLPLAAVLAAAVPAAGADAHVAIVSIVQGFRPGTVTVASGETVTWTNEDPNALHNAICDNSCPETFSSGPSAPKGSVGSHRFVKEGTYRYHCELHPNMVGFVVVTAAATTTTAVGPTTSTSRRSTTTTSSTVPVLTTEPPPTSTTVAPAVVPAPASTEPGNGNGNDNSKVPVLVVTGILVLTALGAFVATRAGERRTGSRGLPPPR